MFSAKKKSKRIGETGPGKVLTQKESNWC